MGTRGLTQVNMGKKPVIAQYGQWDHYPSGQGVTILNFLRKFKGNFDKFKKKLESVRFATDADQKVWDAYYKELGCDGSGWVTMEQAEKFKQKFPLLSRDNGGQILEMVYKCKDKEIVVQDSSDFLNDTVFCEWAYIIDLDKGTFQVCEGNTPIKKYKLDKLPTKTQFLKDLKQEE